MQGKFTIIHKILSVSQPFPREAPRSDYKTPAFPEKFPPRRKFFSSASETPPNAKPGGTLVCVPPGLSIFPQNSSGSFRRCRSAQSSPPNHRAG